MKLCQDIHCPKFFDDKSLCQQRLAACELKEANEVLDRISGEKSTVPIKVEKAPLWKVQQEQEIVESEHEWECPHDDCRRDRDYCPDCDEGDKYLSPDSYKEDR
jgi:hypothetical protein